MNLKNSLFNEIKNFIYCPELSDINVYSKQYLNSVIKPYYSCNRNNYGSIYIDFNKLNDINTKFGFNTGDKVIYYTIYLIKSILPPNSTCARIGGDEFVFIIENCNPNDIQSYISKIYNVIKKHEKSILFSGVTAYGIHSSEISSLSDMINFSDTKITELKNNSSTSSSSWNSLKQKLDKNLNSFFQNLRLYEQPINIDFLKRLYLHSIRSCKNLLEDDSFKLILPNNTKNKSSDISENDKNNLTCLNKSEVEQLYNLLKSKNPTKEEIDEIETSSYISLLEELTHDPITGSFTNEYFSKYAIRNNNFKIKYFSMPFVKLYNTIFSHKNTDEQFRNITEKIINYLENEQHIHFAKHSFLDKSSNYFVSLGGGSYVLALPEDTDIDNSAINNYIESISSSANKLENIMTPICSKDFQHVNSTNYAQVLNQLSCECKKIKDKYKLSILDNSCIEDALSNIIYDSVKFYKNNIPNSEDIKTKTDFLNLISQTMLDISSRLNKENKKDFER